MPEKQIHNVDVCIVGGGPAGMVLGLLLAKLGVRALVLEQHHDFEREYRGEVLMPRFVQMMRQLNLASYIESQHHLKLRELEGFVNGRLAFQIGFDKIAPEAPFALWIPQPILLNALHEKAKQFSGFDLWFDANVRNLIVEGGRTVGASGERAHQAFEIRAKVTVGTDGRFSVVRKRGNFTLKYEHHRFDIIWFTIPKPADYDNRVRFFLSNERNCLILPKYPDSIQCGIVVPKGEFAKLQKNGIDVFRKIILGAHPMFHSFAENLRDFRPFNMLQAKIEYVRKWAKDGVMLIGDSAHTCSPAGAIGVSVAVASAVVGAEVIYDAIQKNDFSEHTLGRLQELREKEVFEIHNLQKRFTQALLARSRFSTAFLPMIVFLLSKLGTLQALQRKLLVMKEPLPISPTLHF